MILQQLYHGFIDPISTLLAIVRSINTGSSSKFMTFVICDLMRQSFCFAFYWSQELLFGQKVSLQKKKKPHQIRKKRSAKHQCGDKTPQKQWPNMLSFLSKSDRLSQNHSLSNNHHLNVSQLFSRLLLLLEEETSVLDCYYTSPHKVFIPISAVEKVSSY